MDAYPRLSRRQLLAALRAHAATYGAVSTTSLHAHAPEVLRSVPMHFVGLAAAREAAGVAGPMRKPGAKTGPKPGSPMPRRPPIWSRDRVIRELRALHRRGRRTAWADLMRTGHADLVHAACAYAGGLRSARRAAGITAPPRRPPKRRWTGERVTAVIAARHRDGRALSFTHAPPVLVSAGIRHFGSWPKAIVAAGIDPKSVRVKRRKYTRDAIVEMLRHEASRGSDLRSRTLAKVMKLEAVQLEFGTLRDAIIAAGLRDVLTRRKHGLQKWSRERVVEVLQERAARGLYTLTPGLHRVVQLYFGGADAARRAAGVASPQDRGVRRVSGRREAQEHRVRSRRRRPKKLT